MRDRRGARRTVGLMSLSVLTACGPHHHTDAAAGPSRSQVAVAPSPAPSLAVRKAVPKPKPFRQGNPAGHAAVPAAARAVDTSHPTRTIGDGTPASCTSAAVVKAVAAGGIITFDCGPGPVTITMKTTAKVRNANATVVLDGGGRVTLSGAGK